MTVKDCYLKFIKLLGTECDVADTLNYFNPVECELALEYFPLTMEETWSYYPKVYFKEFKYPVSRIINCENPTTKVYPNYILTKDKKPIGKIKYYYLPEQKQCIDDISNYSSECLDCIVYGMLSEYHIAHGEYEIASMWFSKYKQEVKRLKLLNIDLTKRENNILNRDNILNYLTDKCQECYDNCIHPKYYPAAGMYCEYKNQWVDHHGGPQKICIGCNGFQPTEETKRYREILDYINDLKTTLL